MRKVFSPYFKFMNYIVVTSKTSPLKVRQSRNDFFKLKFLPKNEQTNSTLLSMIPQVDLFWEEIEDTKKTFRN